MVFLSLNLHGILNIGAGIIMNKKHQMKIILIQKKKLRDDKSLNHLLIYRQRLRILKLIIIT